MIYRCWNCEGEIDTEDSHKCSRCWWFRCPDCGMCGCRYYEEVEPKEEYREREGTYGIDYAYDEDDEEGIDLKRMFG